MSKLSAQAEQWRTLATSLNVNAALNRDPKIQSAMFRIADKYDLMARSAEISHKRYLCRRRHLSIERLEFVSLRRDDSIELVKKAIESPEEVIEFAEVD
jgi:hypothetical protein